MYYYYYCVVFVVFTEMYHLNIISFKAFLGSKIPVIGIWDDHDYGINGGGKVSFPYFFDAFMLPSHSENLV